jgi:DHA2 family methylenomycin A resistance protein-like MFS transporter
MKQTGGSQSLDESVRCLDSNSAISLPSERTKTITLAAMCLVLFMTNFDGTATDVALPKIQQTLGADVGELQWIINAYNLPVASLLLPSGTLGDTYGCKRIFLIGLSIFTIASALCGFAPNLELLLVGRTLQGIGAAALMSLSLTILTATFPKPAEKAKVIGIWSAISALALVAGAGLGGLFIDMLGWHSIFLANVPLGILTLSLSAGVIQQPRAFSQQKLDVLGLGFSTIAIASLTYVITEGSAGAGLSPQQLLWIGVTGVSFLGFWLAEARNPSPLLPLSLLKNSTFMVVNLAQAFVFFTSASLLFMFSLFLQQVQGYSATAAGVCFLPMNTAIIVASFGSGWIAARWGWRFPVISGLTMAGVAILALTHIHAGSSYGQILWNLVLSGLGGGLAIAPLTSAAMSVIPPLQEGIASAVCNIGIQFGGILGIAVQGAVFSHQFTIELQQSLQAWKMPTNLQDQIIRKTLHNLADIPSNLPDSISLLALHQAIKNAFVSGLHATLFIAGFTLLAGSVLILLFVPAKLKARTHS